jgi:hypothetical protein
MKKILIVLFACYIWPVHADPKDCEVRAIGEAKRRHRETGDVSVQNLDKWTDEYFRRTQYFWEAMRTCCQENGLNYDAYAGMDNRGFYPKDCSPPR